MSARAVFSAFVVLISFLSWQSAAFLVDGGVSSHGPVRVGAFNIQRLGATKISNDVVINRIVQILNRFDIVLVQEVQDSSFTGMDKLLSLLNCCKVKWSYVSSLPVGRTSYKEQYVFFYKTDVVSIVSTYTYPDTEDVYERDPYAVRVAYFSVAQSKSSHVVLAGIHIKPNRAYEELLELNNTMLELSTVWAGVEGIVVMGDFNADCNYLNQKERATLTILSSASGAGFRDLIPDTADTTVKDSDCAYDRLIVKGKDVDARNASVYDFKADLGFTSDQAEAVSDHFPIEFLLY